jgi:hypothetical protein
VRQRKKDKKGLSTDDLATALVPIIASRKSSSSSSSSSDSDRKSKNDSDGNSLGKSVKSLGV